MHSLWLSLHLGGAALTGLAVLAALVLIIVRRRQTYVPLAISLSMLAGWQLISGAFLTLTAVETPTLFVYCRNVVAYLAVISITLATLSRQMKREDIAWPARRVLAPLSFGMLTAVVAGIFVFV